MITNWQWVGLALLGMLALLVTPVSWFLRVVNTTARRVITFSRAAIRKVCVDPYCKERGNHDSHTPNA
jgi:hypothetical protein